MSHQAIVWALKQPVKPAPAKQILTVMAHYVSATQGGPWVAFPSVTQLVKDTGQDRKTVMINIKRLEESGYIVDTGEREGITRSVPIFQLKEPSSGAENGTPPIGQSSTKSGTTHPGEAVPNQGHVSGAENGTPSGDGSSTGFPSKQYQIPPEAVPDFPTEQVEQVGTGKEETTTPPPHARVCVREDRPSSSDPDPEISIPDATQSRPVQVAVLLRRNGACYRTTRPDNRAVIELAELGASDVRILTALETAKQQRKTTSSAQPVTAAYLLPIVRELMAAPTQRPRKTTRAQRVSDWMHEAAESIRETARPNEIDMGVIDASDS